MTVPHHVAPGGSRIGAVLPPLFFAPAVGCFVTALALAPFVLPRAAEHFYQPRVLAWTHVLTLGWVSMTMQGVLYRYVPGLTRERLRAPWLGVLQWAAFVGGAGGLVAAVATGTWPAAAVAAGALVAATLLLCANLWPLLWRARRWGVAETGILLATGCFTLGAMLGFVLALDKTWPLMRGTLLANLGAHVHLAAGGWVAVTVCALTFRFLPAFLLAERDGARPARWLVIALTAALALLVATLLAAGTPSAYAAGAVALCLVAYVGLSVGMIRSHRLALDWTAHHALASLAWCLATVAAGLVLLRTGAQSDAGVRVAAAYGVAALLGWISNLIVGVSYKLLPGFVAGARAATGRAAVPLAILSPPPGVLPVVFVTFNGAIALVVVALLTATPGVLTAGTVALAGAGAVYGGTMTRTLAFVVTDPRGAPHPLAVLP